jgi:hypothetical protein
MHVYPGDIEWFKEHPREEDVAHRAEARELEEVDLARDADLVVAVGPLLTREFSTLLAPYAKAVHEFAPALEDCSDRPSPPAGIRCLVLGRAEDFELKGLDIAAKALSLVHTNPRPRLIVRGAPANKGAELWDRLSLLVDKADVDVEVKPFTPDAITIERDILRSSVVMMPSRREGFGLVGLEAIARGVPVLVSHRSGLAEAIVHYCGADGKRFVVPVTGNVDHDSGVWAESLSEILTNREKAFADTQNLRTAFRNAVSWEKSTAAMFDILDAQLQTRGPVAVAPLLFSPSAGNDLRDALASVARNQLIEWSSERASNEVYVHRAEVESAVMERLSSGQKWVSIEGDSGTGKTTILHEFLRRLALSPDEHKVPVFVESTWMHNRDIWPYTPLRPLLSFAVLGPQNTLADLLLQIAEVLRPSGIQLVVLLDTLDAALLNPAWQAASWPTRTISGPNIQVISTCRPLEAESYLPKTRRPVRLMDFHPDEAREAIDAYVRVFYGAMTPGAQAEAKHVLRSYLTSTSFEDLCRRPVTLRMIFEAYPDRPPTEAVNRTRLFADYWDVKVRAEYPSDRARRSTPDLREQMVLEIALRLARQRSVSLREGDVEAIARSKERRGALDDLLSEGVITLQGRKPHGFFAFFHQSFLEYAAARAFLTEANDQRERDLVALLKPLQTGTSSPWFALIEEIAIQAQRYTEHHPLTGDILVSLLQSAVPGSVGSGARVWVHLPKSTDPSVGDLLKANRLARFGCLENLHNAPAERIAELLSDFGVAAWRSGNSAQRLSVFDALVRVASLAPKPTQQFIDELGLEELALRDPTYAGPQRGQYIGKLSRVYAGFLGVDDDFAVSRLEAVYEFLLVSAKDVRLRATLVQHVAERQELSAKAAQLLWTWFHTPEVRDVRSARELRDAFAIALKSAPIDEYEGAREQTLASTAKPSDPASFEARARVFSLWRERVAAGAVSLDKVWRDATDLLDLSAFADFMTIVVEPLARRDAHGLFELLLIFVELTDRTESAHRLRRRERTLHVLALMVHENSRAQAVISAARLQEVPTDQLTGPELEALARCAIAYPRDVNWVTRLVRQVTKLPLFLKHLSEDARLAVEETFRELLARGIPTEDIPQVAGEAGTRAKMLSPETRARVARWLVQVATTTALQPQRRSALRAIPDVLQASADSELAETAVDRIRGTWSSIRVDATASWVGVCIAQTLGFWTPSTQLAHQLRVSALEILRRPPAEWLESRRFAFVVLNRVARSLPSQIVQDLESLLSELEVEHHEIRTADLTGLGQIVYSISASAPQSAWAYAKRIAELGRKGDLGRAGWDSVNAVLTGTIRRALRSPEGRAILLSDLAGLPAMAQAEVVRCAKEEDDEATFRAMQKLRLDLRAAQVFEGWARARASRLDGKSGQPESPS